MQDIYSIGAAGQIIGGGGGDRRLRPHHHHQELKCPRCDSLNTKFCYYNNYNLSQPRHFCKNCRRYWTKGGVLRNVPVGGGCRKAKRAKTKPAPETPPPTQQQRDDKRKSNSNSSSDSSSITAANSSVAVTNNAISSSSAPGAAEAVSAPSSHSNLLNSDSGFEPRMLEQGSDCGIFSEIGTLTSLITSPINNEALSFGFGLDQENQLQNQIPNHHYHHPQKMSMGGEEITAGRLCDPTVQVELSALQSRSNGGGFGIFGPLDWKGDGYQELTDLPTAVDQTYWSQNHFTDQEHPSIFLP
ncbi:hypothetical protein SLE2022_299270 [Rubroshorea leprosula]